MSDALTNQELIEITGFKQPSRQRQALRSAGIPFMPKRDGRPSLTWTSYSAALSGNKMQAADKDNEIQPNFDAI
jgi:hypothetical protein